MYRIAIVMILSVFALSARAEEPKQLIPQPGQWSTMLGIKDPNQNNYLLRTALSSTPDACADELKNAASKITQANGVVWTNRDKNVLSYEHKPLFSEIKVRVLEMRCVLEPFKEELIKKF